jgi:hypothetical protein
MQHRAETPARYTSGRVVKRCGGGEAYSESVVTVIARQEAIIEQPQCVGPTAIVDAHLAALSRCLGCSQAKHTCSIVFLPVHR